MIGLQGIGKQQHFIGLPVTYVAMFLPLAFLAGCWGEIYLRGCLTITIVGLAVAMISTARIRKPSGVFYILFPVSGLVSMFVFIVFADKYLP